MGKNCNCLNDSESFYKEDIFQNDAKLFSAYLVNPTLFIHHFSMEKSRRTREFLTYTNSDEGIALKRAHERLLAKLDSYPSSNHSCAYKKGFNTRAALTAHEGSQIFIKLDIHAFFDSITLDTFVKQFNAQDLSIEEEALKSCFYNGHLPLGFICSPKLSDIYMYRFDQKIESYLRDHPEIRYTRYSDDILISSTNTDFTALRSFSFIIKDFLKDIGLSLNGRKAAEFDLSGEKPKNSSVHFLGLNLVKRGNEYEITLSKRVIHKALDLYRKYQASQTKLEQAEKKYKDARDQHKNGNSLPIEEYHAIQYKYRNLRFYVTYLLNCVQSLVRYIRFNSEKSYLRFTKKFKNEFHQDWES